MSEAQLVKTIKAHIAKGDHAKDKAEQHYISAGQHLKTLQGLHKDRGGTWAEWETLVKEKCGIGKSRASELMQIADGRKTVEQVNERRAESMRQVRSSPPRGGETDEDFGPRGEPLPTRVMINDGEGRLRPASPEEAAATFAVANDKWESRHGIESEIEPDNYRVAFLLRADQAKQFAVYSGQTDKDVHAAACAAGSAWQSLAYTLRPKRQGKSTREQLLDGAKRIARVLFKADRECANLLVTILMWEDRAVFETLIDDLAHRLGIDDDTPEQPKKRGRPKGSKNKPKPVVEEPTTAVVADHDAAPKDESLVGNDPGPFPSG